MGNFAFKIGQHPDDSTVLFTSSVSFGLGMQETTHTPWAPTEERHTLAFRSVATPLEIFIRPAPSLWINLAAEGSGGLQESLGQVGRLKLGVGTKDARLSGHAGMTVHNLYDSAQVLGAEFCLGNITQPGLAFVASYERARTGAEGDVANFTVGARYILPWLSYHR